MDGALLRKYMSTLLLSVFFVNGVGKPITNFSQYDGFGSQFQLIIAAAVYAELQKRDFVYTPFQRMEHNYNNDPQFIAKKEQFINFIDNFPLNTGNADSVVNYKEFFDNNIVRCSQAAVLKKIKTIFRSNKQTSNYFNNTNLNIVIHLRRPNPHDIRKDGADTPDALFAKIIDKLRLIYAARNPLFHIQSQGSPALFECFKAPDVVLHLDESVEDAFLSMVLADVLVTSRSSLSYTAGLLSEGVVYYIPFWHKPLLHWISVDSL